MGKKLKIKEEPLEEEVKKISLEEPQLSYDDKLQFVSPIAKPMATKSQAKKIYKLLKKAVKEKDGLKFGLKNVQKILRSGGRGLCIFAGDITPIDIMCHLPAVCEEKGVLYCYTPSKKDLGSALNKNSPVMTVIVFPHSSYQDSYDDVCEEVKEMQIPVDETTNTYLPQGKI